MFAQATDNAAFPPGTRLALVSPETFRTIHEAWLQKNPAQLGRVICAVAFTVSFYRLLGLGGPAVDRLAPVFQPLGESSLYVFLVHVPLIAAVDQLPGYFERPIGFAPDTVWMNTLLLGAIIAVLWLLVRGRVLFGIIPR